MKAEDHIHNLDTERLRCSCGAPMCFSCGCCSAQCACETAVRALSARDASRASNANSKLLIDALKGHL